MPLTRPPASLLAALPGAAQARLRAIGGTHRTEFGTCRHYQAAVDEHIAFFDELVARGASHLVLGKLLAEVGIARPDGSPLPLGTISGALSRARERAAVPAAARPPLQDPTGPHRGAQEPAGPRKTAQAPTGPARARPRTTGRGRPAAKPSPAEDASPAVQRTADILNKLRSAT